MRRCAEQPPPDEPTENGALTFSISNNQEVPTIVEKILRLTVKMSKSKPTTNSSAKKKVSPRAGVIGP